MQRFSCNLLNRIKILSTLLMNAALCVSLLAIGSIACAQEQGGQSLGQAAEDPTASLMSLQVADWYTAGFHKLIVRTQTS